MTGFGKFGPLEMGGMFTVVKVRKDLAAGDYKNGWFTEGSTQTGDLSQLRPPA
jgi:hypothetical protein